VVRPAFDAGILIRGMLGAAFLLAGVHWAALAYWRTPWDTRTAMRETRSGTARQRSPES